MRVSNAKWSWRHALPRAIAGTVLCIAGLLLPLQSRATGQTAAPISLSLDYSAVPACPGADDFKSIVVGRLGYDPFGDALPEHVLVEIAARAPAFEGRIEWRDADGNWAGDRTFPSRSDDCGDLASAMAFALALQIQLAVNARTPATASNHPPQVVAQSARDVAAAAAPPATVPAAETPKTVAAVTEAAVTPNPRARPVLALGAGALVAFGVSSTAVPMGRVAANLAWSHVAFELDAEVGLPATVRRTDGAGFSQQQLLAGLAGCGLIGRLGGCWVAKAGAIRVVGEDIDVPASPWLPVVETGVRLSFRQPLGRHFYAAAQAEGLLLVTRWRVTLDRTAVWTSSRFAETVGLDLGVRFP